MGKDAFEAIAEGLQAAIDFQKGKTKGAKIHDVPMPDVAAARKRLKLSQRKFSELFSIPLTSVRNWEQGTRVPDGATRVLLRVVENEPEAVLRALYGDKKKVAIGAKKRAKSAVDLKRKQSGKKAANT